MPRLYEADALVMLNEGRARTVPGIEDAVPYLAPTEERLQGQILLIRSRGMAERLIDELHLQLLPEFNPALRPQSTSLLSLFSLLKVIPDSWAESLMTSTSQVEMSDERQAELLRAEIIKNVLSNMRAEPVTRSSALNLGFRSDEPSLAALGANRLAELYLSGQLEHRYLETRQQTANLDEAIALLRQEIAIMEQAIQEFRREHSMIDRPGERSALDQQIAELTTRRW